MAREIVRYEHAVYDTYNHKRGAKPSVDSGALGDLLVEADQTLDREPGFFFDTLDGQFVFGFERKREDDHGQNRSMGYFDLFVTPVADVSGIPLSVIKASLEEKRVRNFETEPEHEEAIQYTLESGDASPGDPNSNAQPSLDPVMVADLWERYRRDSAELRLTLQELETVVDAVDGLLPEVSYVARRDGDDVRSDYFDVLDGRRDDERVADENLVDVVDTLQSQGRLTYANLPTYRDELDQQRKQKKSDIQGNDLDETVERLFQTANERTQSRVDAFPTTATELIDKAIADELPADDADADEPESEGRPPTYLVGIPLVLLGGTLLSGIFAELLSGGLLSSLVWTGITSVGAALIAILVFEFGVFDYASASTRRIVLDGGLVVGIAVVVGVVGRIGVPAVGGDVSAVGLGPLSLGIATAAGTFIGLLGSYGAILLRNQWDAPSGDSDEDSETALLDSHEVDGVDADVVAAVDEQIQAETEELHQWIDDRVITELERELHQKTEQRAENAAKRTVDGIQELKQSVAYEEADLSDDSD
ncbi:MAG: hypothetical protein ABEJ73_02730 [Haloplanus sp.]